jgi:pimeloyl-ACP methyl ester carboxylesterase
MPATITEASVPVSRGRHLAVQVLGDGEPVTVYAHPWGANADLMRPLAAGVPGSRVLIDFGGHGRSPAEDEPWRYHRRADDLHAVLDHVGARRVVAQSMGAGAALRLMRLAPGLLEQAVLLLPPAPHRPADGPTRQLLAALHAQITGGDVKRLAAALRACLDDELVHPRETADYLRLYAARLLRSRTPRHAAGDFPWAGLEPGPLPLPPRLLVLGQEGDRIHAVEDARDVARMAPGAALHVYPAQDPLWRQPADVRTRVRTFLAGTNGPN